MNLKNNQSGQGLLELVIAFAVITVGLFAVMNLFLSNFSGEEEAKARIIGVNLAREGAEAVKNIRDTNWLKVDVNDNTCGAQGNETCRWDDGLIGDGTAIINGIVGGGAMSLDYSPNNISADGAKLYVNDQGFYVHEPSTQATSYRRLITIKNICCNDSDNNFKCDDIANGLVFQNPGIDCANGQLKISIDVVSQVTWQLSGKDREAKIEEQLFNWK